MDSFLIMNGILRDQVETINVASNAIVDMLTSGKVDAVSTWNPHISKLKKSLGIGTVKRIFPRLQKYPYGESLGTDLGERAG